MLGGAAIQRDHGAPFTRTASSMTWPGWRAGAAFVRVSSCCPRATFGERPWRLHAVGRGSILAREIVEREALAIRLELNSSPFVLVGLFCFVQANISSGGWLTQAVYHARV